MKPQTFPLRLRRRFTIPKGGGAAARGLKGERSSPFWMHVKSHGASATAPPGLRLYAIAILNLALVALGLIVFPYRTPVGTADRTRRVQLRECADAVKPIRMVRGKPLEPRGSTTAHIKKN